jgi:hypothetical protein
MGKCLKKWEILKELLQANLVRKWSKLFKAIKLQIKINIVQLIFEKYLLLHLYLVIFQC